MNPSRAPRCTTGRRCIELTPLNSNCDGVAKLSRRGLSGRKIAAELNIPAGSVFSVLKKARDGSLK